MTVVIVPEGSSTTMLLGQWARDPHERRKIACVSLNQADDDRVRFWSYVLTALSSVAPSIVEEPGCGGKALIADRSDPEPVSVVGDEPETSLVVSVVERRSLFRTNEDVAALRLRSADGVSEAQDHPQGVHHEFCGAALGSRTRTPDLRTTSANYLAHHGG